MVAEVASQENRRKQHDKNVLWSSVYESGFGTILDIINYDIINYHCKILEVGPQLWDTPHIFNILFSEN